MKSYAILCCILLCNSRWTLHGERFPGNARSQSGTSVPHSKTLRVQGALPRIRSFMTKLFRHEEREEREVLMMTNFAIFLRDLRVLRGKNWVAAWPRCVLATLR
jgi:hypothetical protein